MKREVRCQLCSAWLGEHNANQVKDVVLLHYKSAHPGELEIVKKAEEDFLRLKKEFGLGKFRSVS